MSYLGRRGDGSLRAIRFANAGGVRLHRPTRLPTLLATTSFARRVQNFLWSVVGR